MTAPVSFASIFADLPNSLVSGDALSVLNVAPPPTMSARPALCRPRFRVQPLRAFQAARISASRCGVSTKRGCARRCSGTASE